MDIGQDHVVIALDIGTQNMIINIQYYNFDNATMKKHLLSVISGQELNSLKESSDILLDTSNAAIIQKLQNNELDTYQDYQNCFSHSQCTENQQQNCIITNYKQDFCKIWPGKPMEIQKNDISTGNQPIKISLKYLFTFNYFKALYQAFSFLNKKSNAHFYSKLSFVICVPALTEDHQRQLLQESAGVAYQLALRRYQDENPRRKYIPPQYQEKFVIFLAEPECGSYQEYNPDLFKDGERFMVVDCGAGTFDISIFQQIGRRLQIQAQPIRCTRGGADMQKYIKYRFKQLVGGDEAIYQLLFYQMYETLRDYNSISQIMRQNSNQGYIDMFLTNYRIKNTVEQNSNLKEQIFNILKRNSNQMTNQFTVEIGISSIDEQNYDQSIDIDDYNILIKRKLFLDALEQLQSDIFNEIGEELKKLGKIDNVLCIGGLFEMEMAFVKFQHKLAGFLNLVPEKVIRHSKASVAVSEGSIPYFIALSKNPKLFNTYIENTFKKHVAPVIETVQLTTVPDITITDSIILPLPQDLPKPALAKQPVIVNKQPQPVYSHKSEHQYGYKYWTQFTEEIQQELHKDQNFQLLDFKDHDGTKYIKNLINLFQDKNVEYSEEKIQSNPIQIGVQTGHNLIVCKSSEFKRCGSYYLYTQQDKVNGTLQVLRQLPIENVIAKYIDDLKKQADQICKQLKINQITISSKLMVDKFNQTQDISYLRVLLNWYIQKVKNYLSFSQTFYFGFDKLPKISDAVFQLTDGSAQSKHSLQTFYKQADVQYELLDQNLVQFSAEEQCLIELLVDEHGRGKVYLNQNKASRRPIDE